VVDCCWFEILFGHFHWIIWVQAACPAVRSAAGLVLRFLTTKDSEKFTESKAAEKAHKDHF